VPITLPFSHPPQAQAFADETERLLAAGQYKAAVQQLQRAIGHGHLPSRALKAWMLLDGREGVAQDCDAAFELVEEGARLGCNHCRGVMAIYYWYGNGCVRDAARSLELAHESSGKGSKYGQYALGRLYVYGGDGVERDYAQALAFYRLAAAQNFDGAQISLGTMYDHGLGVAQNLAEALRWYQLAAIQGHPEALFNVAYCHWRGLGVRENKATATRWYKLAQAAGHPNAAAHLKRLRA
jgi:TPR repeat protein